MADVVPQVKMILVTGGVISGVGKGVISSSIGVLLKAHGFNVSFIKIDPYINIDAGTFSPLEHGEVFVLDDGGEVDIDLGNYERFLNVRLTSDNSITTGKIYQHVIKRERRGDYLGKTVQTIPHVTNAIIEWVLRVASIPVDGTDIRPDVCIIELGGTIGDIEGMPYTAAFERFHRPSNRDSFMNVHVSLILNPKSTGEPKTKPMQNSIRNSRTCGLPPDLLVCRSDKPLSQALRYKIADFGIVGPEQVIGIYNVPTIYKVPLLLHEQNVLQLIIDRLKLPQTGKQNVSATLPNMLQWTRLSDMSEKYEEEVRIGIVGKYIQAVDAYASLSKALHHSALFAERKVVIDYIDACDLIDDGSPTFIDAWHRMKLANGIVVPGGFGSRGIEGKILACKFARESKVPFLGICLGMQCAAIEFARNVCRIRGANSTEFDENLREAQKVVIEMPEHASINGLGGTMRLGLRESIFLTEQCLLSKLYRAERVRERHRHRYEINPRIVSTLAHAGFIFVGMGLDEEPAQSSVCTCDESLTQLGINNENIIDETKKMLPKRLLLEKIESMCDRSNTSMKLRMEMCELEDHPYYVGVQFHPEYLSSPMKPSPPLFGLVCAAAGKLENFRKDLGNQAR